MTGFSRAVGWVFETPPRKEELNNLRFAEIRRNFQMLQENYQAELEILYYTTFSSD